MDIQHTVRYYQYNDEENIVQFLNLVFDGWPHFDLSCSNVDHWRWKFLDNPLNYLFVALCVDGDKIIGSHHQIPQKIKIGDQILLCTTAVDFGVHPDYRRKGISKLASEHNGKKSHEAGVILVTWGTGNPVLLKHYARTRPPTFPHRIIHMIKIWNIEKHLIYNHREKALLLKIGYYFFNTWNKIISLFVRIKRTESKLEYTRINRFDEDINEFWEIVAKEHMFIQERKHKYLNWRYCDKRGGDYITIVVKEENSILGYLVLRVNKYKQEYHQGYIVDLLTLPERLDVAQDLVEYSMNFFREQDINIINSWVIKGHPYEAILREYGFIDGRTDMQIFYGSSEGLILDSIKRESPSRVHFTYGDLDWI